MALLLSIRISFLYSFRMKIKLFVLVAFLFTVILSSCTHVTGAKNESSAGLSDGKWILAKINGEAPSPGAEGEFVYIRLDAREGRFEGYSGCNRFFGSFTASPDGDLEFSGIGSTRQACPDSTVEMKLFGALEKTASFGITSDTLMFFDTSEKPAASFVLEK